MMTADDRVAALHARMDARRRVQEQRKTFVIGACCILNAVCLFLFIFGSGIAHGGGTTGIYSGAMMLFEDAGGYVLVAVISFTAAVIITVLCMRHQMHNKETLGGNKKKEETIHEK